MTAGPRAGRVEGKVALVTGSASGIGRVTAETLAREGARLVLVDLDLEGARDVADGIRTAGGDAMAVRADVSQCTRRMSSPKTYSRKVWKVMFPSGDVSAVGPSRSRTNPGGSATIGQPWARRLGMGS